MKRSIVTLALAGALALATTTALAQATPPPLPNLTPEQSTRVAQDRDRYQRGVDQRLARGEVTPDEAQRLVAWHEWQFAQQLAGRAAARSADVPPDYVAPPARGYDAVPYYAAPAPAYSTPAPYYAPYPYYAYPGPYYAYPYYAPPRGFWGPTVCAGGFGRHGFARLCL